jgi:hypothetical protein
MLDSKKESRFPKGIGWGITGLFLIFVIGFGISWYLFRESAKKEVAAQSGNLVAGINNLQSLDFKGAAGDFDAVSLASSDFRGPMALFGTLFGSNNPIAAFLDLSKNLSDLSSDLETTEHDVPDFFSGVSGGGLLADLRALAATLHGIDGDTQKISDVISLSGTSIPGGSNFLAWKTQLQNSEAVLDVLVPWLESSSPHHILVLLQNPSELRASGGFLGSYADITIASGTITNIAVHDIADVDAVFKKNIVPPKQLQIEVARWRPADANWFFDFPTSASQTISFFEASDLYNGRSSSAAVSFDGAIAISPKIISDLLSLTGPITVSSTHTTFTSENFLIQIQKIVQAGQAASQTQYPKQVLNDLFKGMFSGPAFLASSTSQNFLALAENWISRKDLVVYFKDPAFERFAENAGAGGDVYALPQNFEGDYFALANTNIKGQKSDLYVSEAVSLQSQINSDGTVDDHLTLKRVHSGNKSPYWWYDATNQDYVELFTVPGAALSDESGGVLKAIPTPLNYMKEGYSTDPVIASIESSEQTIFSYPAVTSHEESGKEVFGTWSIVKPGSSATLSFDYSHRLFLVPAAGTVYQFIFDKQPGTSRSYTIEINAPIGFAFVENGLSSYTYESDDPPARLMLSLTLVPTQ